MKLLRVFVLVELLTTLIFLSGHDVSAQTEEKASSVWPVVELRQYTLHADKRDTFVELFDAEFLESQESTGMKIVGQFRDLDRPDRFVWIRAFKDMASRAEALTAFYSGAVWKAHSKAANSTMVDVGNVLLLRPSAPGAGFDSERPPRPAKGERVTTAGVIVAVIYQLSDQSHSHFSAFFDDTIRPRLRAAGLPVLASFVTDASPNNFPRLPVRENERVFVWVTRAAGTSDYERRVRQLREAPGWKDAEAALEAKLKAPPEVLRLQPTPRSELRN